MQALFAVTLFTSAFLLFLVQPLVGRMLLPLLGGSPAVWNTCMVFFQASLLAGYGYSHLISSRLSLRWQLILHVPILALPAIVLPVAVSEDVARAAAETSHPEFLVLKILFLAVGLPFFVVATTGPLVQRWFAQTGHSSAIDPYFLYAASNLGSVLALLAYPSIFEPFLRVSNQNRIWAIGYAICAALIVTCGVTLWRQGVRRTPDVAARQESETAPSWKRRARWVFLAFVPSSFLIGTTTFLSTDITPIPLLWIIPLALYLLTFILVFAKRPPLSHAWMNRLLPLAVLILTLVLLTGATDIQGLPVGVFLVLNLIVFFLIAMVAHGELAHDRPAAEHLTDFYFWLSVGGVLGGIFNALLAPVLFKKTGLTEYPVALVLACFLLRPGLFASNQERGSRTKKSRVKQKPADKNRGSELKGGNSDTSIAGIFGSNTDRRKQHLLDIAIPFIIGAITVGLILFTIAVHMEAGPLRTMVMFAAPCMLMFLQANRPIRFALAVAAVLLAGSINPDETLRLRERNFFGVLKVSEVRNSETEQFRVLYHGSTRHGQQDLIRTDSEGRHEPLTYYHTTGPVGHIFRNWSETRLSGKRVAAVGLGTGSIAYYALPGEDWTFYEIDPAVVRLAEDPKYFSFLSESRASNRRMIVGDARLRLREAASKHYDLLVFDAFSSDAIPMHLMTQEAMQLYVEKLADNGIIAFHVSNRYLKLQPFLAKVAESTSPRLVARHWDDTQADPSTGKSASQWVILARSQADLGLLASDLRWEELRPDPNTPLWTDDFSNLLSAFKW